MLCYLKIKNFALIDELNVEFEQGLNVITGETGAGKSMIIEAINVILGAPFNPNWLKNEQDFLEIEALFYLDSISPERLEELKKTVKLPLEDLQIVIKRKILQTKRSSCFINNQLVTLSFLQQIGNYLIDLHGQHEHQSLLNPESHIDFVDSFGNHSFLEQKEQFDSTYKQWQHKNKLLHQLVQKHSEVLSKRDYFLFQLREIEQAKLKEGEDCEIEEILNVIRHQVKIKEIMEMANEVLLENGNNTNVSVYDVLTRLISSFNTISILDQNINRIKEQLTDLNFKVEDISAQIIEYKEKIDLDVYQLQEAEERLNLINHLKHKYGSQIGEILKYQDHLQAQLSSMEDDEAEIGRLNKEIKEDEEILTKLSLALSSQRKTISQQLARDIIKELAELGMKDCNFLVQIEQQEDQNGLKIGDRKIKINSKGIDRIEFFISTNAGEKLKPLSEIVSGGEVSRIMLGLKSILSKADQIPTMIFDEIDSGVGARLGETIARKLAKLAHSHQVIAVTHLPQIACQADQHLYINKYASQNKTTIELKKLSKDEQLYEIAKMLDGEKYGSISIEHARKMLDGQKGERN
ncbi:MAG TPA: DNA repair protein RecN [Atribacterota bacterium]|nr:DNA repair protein RecN [Atribacterota bacterium]